MPNREFTNPAAFDTLRRGDGEDIPLFIPVRYFLIGGGAVPYLADEGGEQFIRELFAQGVEECDEFGELLPDAEENRVSTGNHFLNNVWRFIAEWETEHDGVCPTRDEITVMFEMETELVEAALIALEKMRVIRRRYSDTEGVTIHLITDEVPGDQGTSA